MSFKKKVERTIMLLKKKNLVPIPEVVNDTDLLEDKVAMVIGGTGGIGGAITTELMNALRSGSIFLLRAIKNPPELIFILISIQEDI